MIVAAAFQQLGAPSLESCAERRRLGENSGIDIFDLGSLGLPGISFEHLLARCFGKPNQEVGVFNEIADGNTEPIDS
jgi:hypothetical protein